MKPTNPLERLIYSRKFWIALVTAILAVISEQLQLSGDVAQALVLLATVLIGSIAAEDMAEKLSMSPGGNDKSQGSDA